MKKFMVAALLLGVLNVASAAAQETRIVRIEHEYQDAPPLRAAIEYCERRKTHPVCQRSKKLGRGVSISRTELQKLWSKHYKKFVPEADVDAEKNPNDVWRDDVWRGDCEDIILSFRRVAVAELGWSVSDFAIVFALDGKWQNRGHALLVVRTQEGDYILDVASWRVRTPQQTEEWEDYTYVKRTSLFDPTKWVYMGGVGTTPIAKPARKTT